MNKQILVGVVAGTLLILCGVGAAWAQTGDPDYESRTRHDFETHQAMPTGQEAERATSWTRDGTASKLGPALRRFFGKATGVYLDDADQFPKYHGLPLVVEHVLRVFGDVPTGNFTTVSGYRVLASAKSGNAEYHVYVATYGTSAHIAAVGFVYFFCPQGGYTPKSGIDKGMHLHCENDPTLTIFYPKNFSGGVTRIPEVDKAMTYEAQTYFGNIHQSWWTKGEHYQLTVNVRGIQGEPTG